MLGADGDDSAARRHARELLKAGRETGSAAAAGPSTLDETKES